MGKIRTGKFQPIVSKVLFDGSLAQVGPGCNITKVFKDEKAPLPAIDGLKRPNQACRNNLKRGCYICPGFEREVRDAGWNTLVVRPSIGEDGELAEPKAPAGARPPLPALPARAELRDAEVHAMLGELDFGESAVMGDATAEERQAIANFDIRAYA